MSVITQPARKPTRDALGDALRAVRFPLVHVVIFSFLINLLMLTAPLYMLQIYDRVLASRSAPTLIFLTLVAVGALGIMAILDVVRSRLLVRVSGRIDQSLAPVIFSAVVLRGKSGDPLRDLGTVRTFVSGPSLITLLDAPWVPVYLGVVYLMHPVLGHTAFSGGLILFALAILNDRSTRRPLSLAVSEAAAANRFAEVSARNSAAVRAMGMLSGLSRVWFDRHQAGLGYQAVASDRAGGATAAAKLVRFVLQVAMLGVGAYLAIIQEITPGVMIAASIIAARALAPLEGSIGGWRALVDARGAYGRLKKVVEELGSQPETMPLPAPRGHIRFENVYAKPPGAERPVLLGVSLEIRPGDVVGIVGPSGAGKSSFARLVVGVWRPSSGHVRLDESEVYQWDAERLGPSVGYLPQEVELFPGSVADNIARFGEVDSDRVVEAAMLAGADRVIRELPKGYDTPIGAGGHNVSGGQRQRIALARAFYGDPPLIVLDEPTSNLDSEGEQAVRSALETLKQRGRTVLIIAHRPALVQVVDTLVVMQQGVVALHGPVAEVLPRITRQVTVPTGRNDVEGMGDGA